MNDPERKHWATRDESSFNEEGSETRLIMHLEIGSTLGRPLTRAEQRQNRRLKDSPGIRLLFVVTKTSTIDNGCNGGGVL